MENLASPTPTNGTAVGEEKKGFHWPERPRLSRNRPSNNGHKVSFSGSSKGSHKENGYSSQSDKDNSRPNSPRPPKDGTKSPMWSPPDNGNNLTVPIAKEVPWQMINRQGDAVWQ